MSYYAFPFHPLDFNAPLSTYSFTLDNLGVNPIVSTKEEKKKEKKMFNKMSYDCVNDCEQTVSLNTESVQRDYILDRLSREYNDHTDILLKQFGLVSDNSPETPQSLVDRILAGKYVLKDNKNEPIYDPARRIIWRDPSIKEDRPGFDVAVKVLGTAYDSAKDTIVLGTLDEGKAALSAFQQWTYKPTLN